MRISRSIYGFEVRITITEEDGLTFAFAHCPYPDCNREERSFDTTSEVDQLAALTARKMRSHLIHVHGHTEADEGNAPSSNR